jgi:hypothetical protein
MNGTLAALSQRLARLAKEALHANPRAITSDDGSFWITLAGLATLAGSLLQTRVPTRDNINKLIVLLLLLS